MEATARVVRKIKKRIQSNKEDAKDIEKLIVFFCHQVRLKLTGKKKYLWAKSGIESGWTLHPDVDIGSWREFLAESDGEVVEAVVFSKILNFKDQPISQGLGITIGTLRYRLGNGIRLLGLVAQPGLVRI